MNENSNPNYWIKTSSGHFNPKALTHTKILKLEDGSLGIFLFAGNRQMGAFGGDEGAKLIELFDYICLLDITQEKERRE